MNKILLYISSITLALLCTACAATDEPAPDGGKAARFANGVMRESADGSATEPMPDGSTFRAMVYLTGALDYQTTGTYVYDRAISTDYLTAAKLDADGNFVQADPTAAASGVAIASEVVLVSPGNGVQSPGDGFMAVLAYPNRVDTDGNDAGAIYASSSERFDVGEYATISFTDPMRERRSKISFEVRNDEGIDEALTVNSIKVTGAGSGIADEAVLYYPQTRQCAVPDGVADEMDFGAASTLTDSDGRQYCKSATKFVLSAIYAPKSVVAEKIGVTEVNANLLDSSYLSAKLNFTQGSRTVDANLMLNADTDGSLAELQPRHEYIFKVVVASTYIKIHLTIKNHPGNDWQTPDGNHDETIDDGDTIFLGAFPINEWNRVDYPEQEF